MHATASAAFPSSHCPRAFPLPEMSDRDRFLEKLRVSLESGAFVKLTLSQPTDAVKDLRNLYARIVELRDGSHVSCVWRYATRDVTKNFAPPEALETIGALLGHELERAHLFTTTGDWHLRCDAAGEGRLKAARPAFLQLPQPDHDREKTRAISTRSDFLRALGVTNADGQPRPGMTDKLRQIERFTELLGHLVDDSPLREKREVRVVDMGAGKGYLTFATHEFFRARGVVANVTGIELREDLVKLANGVAKEIGVDGLRFVRGAIGEVSADECDLLIALHACDTATDDALHEGIRAGASLIVAAPCCHKELRRQMQPPPVLRDVLKHGILFEREAEIVTDAIRALLLEIHGYKASVFEFISPEHTGKNLMIAAQRRTHPPDPAPMCARLRELLAFYDIREQHLAQKLGEQ